MARVRLAIADPVNRLTLKTLLEADGHACGDEDPGIIVTDDLDRAASFVREAPTLVVAGVSQLRDAVDAMRRGVYGYILIPFVPGEAELMVRRGAASEPAGVGRQQGPLEDVETEHILETLRRCRGNRAEAARQLCIGRNTLWRKLKRIEAKRSRE